MRRLPAMYCFAALLVSLFGQISSPKESPSPMFVLQIIICRIAFARIGQTRDISLYPLSIKREKLRFQ